jgi:DNA-binding HxlR family transcriptional regulator
LLFATGNRVLGLIKIRNRYFSEVEKMDDDHRSDCPINLSLEVFGDRWTLLVIRDVMFGGKRHFRELLRSEEGIASNILADRLRKLVEEEMLTKSPDPTHKQKAIYSLTEKSISLVPVFAQLGAWGSRHLPASEEASAIPRALEAGGPAMWRRFMAELREEHLGATAGGGPEPGGASVASELRAAYEGALAGAAPAGADPPTDEGLPAADTA